MILLGDAAKVLKDFNDGCIDLIVTSPPYDNLRTYNGFVFDFESIARELYRITTLGGVVVWIVNDQTIDGDKSGTSFKQALYFKKIGFKLYDTMIYAKTGICNPQPNKYHQIFEYMFVFSKGLPKTFNGLMDRQNLHVGSTHLVSTKRTGNKISRRKKYIISEYGLRYNIWTYSQGGKFEGGIADLGHPAVFPQQLAEDHIKSWSNEGDLVLDPFCGSGTTLKAAHQLNRKWIGIEISPKYVQLAKKRLTPYIQQQKLTTFA